MACVGLAESAIMLEFNRKLSSLCMLMSMSLLDIDSLTILYLDSVSYCCGFAKTFGATSIISLSV